MGIVRTVDAYEYGYTRVEIRDDGSYWVQVGVAGFIIRDKEELEGLRDFLNYILKEVDDG